MANEIFSLNFENFLSMRRRWRYPIGGEPESQSEDGGSEHRPLKQTITMERTTVF